MKRHEQESGVAMMRGYVLQVQAMLHDSLKALLLVEKGVVREEVLAWMGEIINSNAGRKKMQIDVLTCASHGAFVNFCAVMLRLCTPFLEPTGAKWVRGVRRQSQPGSVSRRVRPRRDRHCVL